MQEQASNHLKLLWSKAMVVSVEEKSWHRPWQVWIKETSASEPLMRCRNRSEHQNRGLAEFRDESRGSLFTAWAVLGIKVA